MGEFILEFGRLNRVSSHNPTQILIFRKRYQVLKTVALAAVSETQNPVSGINEKSAMSRSFAFAPRLLPAPAAAHYLGMSESKLRGLRIPRREDGANRLYDIRHLDEYADNLPIEGAQEWQDHQQADQAFAIAAE